MLTFTDGHEIIDLGKAKVTMRYPFYEEASRNEFAVRFAMVELTEATGVMYTYDELVEKFGVTDDGPVVMSHVYQGVDIVYVEKFAAVVRAHLNQPKVTHFEVESFMEIEVVEFMVRKSAFEGIMFSFNEKHRGFRLKRVTKVPGAPVKVNGSTFNAAKTRVCYWGIHIVNSAHGVEIVKMKLGRADLKNNAAALLKKLNVTLDTSFSVTDAQYNPDTYKYEVIANKTWTLIDKVVHSFQLPEEQQPVMREKLTKWWDEVEFVALK